MTKSTLVLFFLFSLSASELIINSPSQHAQTITAPSARFEREKWDPITGQLVAIDDDGCDEISAINASGRILMFKSADKDGRNLCPYSTRLLNAQKAGAIATVMMGDRYGASSYVLLTERYSDLRIHGVTIGTNASLFELVLNLDNYFNVTVTPGENAYQAFFKTEAPMTIFSLVFEIYAFICFCLASWKLSGFIIFKQRKLGFPGVVLSLEVCSAIIRMIHMVDPVYNRGIYPFSAIAILITLSNPFTFASTLLLIFYWEEIVRKTKTIGMPNVKKIKYPSILAIAFLFIITLTDSISRGLYAGYPRLNIVTPIIFVLLSAILAIFYIIAGVRLLSNVSRSTAVEQKLSERKKNLRRITVLIILCACSLVIMSIAWMAYIGFLTQPPATQFFGWWLVFGSQYSVSLFLILAFQRPRSEKDSSSSDHKAESGEVKKQKNVELENKDQDSTRSFV